MLNNIEVMRKVKSVKDVDTLHGKRVLIRVDFNVPMDSELNITDDTRIREALPTINYCIDNGAKYVILVSHLGRPKEKEDKYSLRHIVKRVERLLSRDILFIKDFQTQKDEVLSQSNSKVIIFENTRFYAGETKNDKELSRELASFCDVYINDAFGTSHRKHASTYGICEFAPTNVAGLLLKKEIDSFAKALANPNRPVLLIVGGAKVSSKLTLLNEILDVVDKIVIGGAMSNTFLKALGHNMQKSLVEEDLLSEALQILEKAKHKGVKIYIPVDVVVTDDVANPTLEHVKISPVQDIPANYMTADIGPATLLLFKEVVASCDTIIWNGPMGIYEIDKFSRGTFRLAHYIADTYAYSLVGGGDTADAVDKSGEKDNMSFISTGGGASLELLEGKVLPAFEILEKN